MKILLVLMLFLAALTTWSREPLYNYHDYVKIKLSRFYRKVCPNTGKIISYSEINGQIYYSVFVQSTINCPISYFEFISEDYIVGVIYEP